MNSHAMRHTRLRLPLLLSFLVFAEVAANPPAQSSDQSRQLLSGAEFPDYDAAILRAQRNGMVNNSLSARLKRQPRIPELADLLQQERVDEAIQLLRSIIKSAPQDIPTAFKVVVEQSGRFSDVARGYPESLQELVDAARTQLPRLSREDAARTERQLLLVDRRVPPDQRRSTVDRLRPFVEEYAGTETALLTEVDVIEFGLPIRQKLIALDAVARDHFGSVVAAKALYVKGFHLGSGNVYPDVEARGSDPTGRFLKVMAIVNELESGRYPQCEWVDRAPSLVSNFFAYNPTYAPGSIDITLRGYQEFVKTHFAVADEYPLTTGTGEILTTKMLDLFKIKGEGIAGVERMLMELEREVADPSAVQFLRARFYVQCMDREPVNERPAFYRKAVASLSQLASSGTAIYHRKALATLASLYFAEGEYRTARAAFRKYLSGYPRTTWAWVAALRIGQCSEVLGESISAVDAYLRAAVSYSTLPMAYVLGHAYAARNYEALGRFDRASREYEIALAGWTKGYGSVYSLHRTRNSRSNRPSIVPDNPDVTSIGLADRIAQLQTSIASPGGTLLERGRWSVEHGRDADAVIPLEQLLNQNPNSPLADAARYLLHRARLASALQLADVANTRPNTAAALAQLQRIATDRYDFGVCAAKIARASILFRTGARREAETQMRAALMEWFDNQRADRERVLDGVQKDVADIRNIVLNMRTRSLQQRSSDLFLVLNPDVSVSLRGTQITRHTVYHAVTSASHVVFLNKDQQRILTDIVAKLGNKPTGEHPAGMDVLEFWNSFFQTDLILGGTVTDDDRPRVAFESYPIVAELEFLNAEHTRAAARIVSRSRGGTIVLEKGPGGWTAKPMVNFWVA
jgi:tetratricopeptide (TPR) repeat protein